MSALSIQPTYPIFTDIDGQPLEDGYVWIGTANLDPQTNPINVYWDAALTLPAAQPIRTLAGYPSNSGTPARLYVNSDYSIRVMNKNGSTVYSAPEATEAYGGGIINASQVVYDPAGIGAVPTTVQAKLRETVSVKDFGAVGDGVTDDTTAIQAALAASNSIIFPSGNYYLGEYNSSNDVVFQLYNGTYTIQNIGDVTLTLRTAAGVGDCFPTVFDLYNAGNSSFGTFSFTDLGYDDSTTNRRGLKAYKFTADSGSGTWGNVHIQGITCNDCIGPVFFEGADATNRVSGVKVDYIGLDNCYYGVNALNQGDNVSVGLMSCNQVRRVYFVYGCKGHRATIADQNPKGSTGTVNISRSVGGFDTTDITINYSCYQTTVNNQLYVLINHIDLLGGEISNINLNLDIDVDLVATPLRFINYDGAGNQTSAASLNVVDNVIVSGRFGATCTSILTIASYITNKGALTVNVPTAVVGSNTASAFRVRNKKLSYTPTWTGAISNPALGDGSLSGDYELIGDTCTFNIVLTMGATTTYGSGSFIFSLPMPADNFSVLPAYALEFGANHYTGLALVTGGGPDVFIVSNNSSDTWRSVFPFIFGNTDRIWISGTYIVQD